jgi:hypothetical protein
VQVRIFSTADGTKLRELRRGSDPAAIYCLAFSRGDLPDWVAVTSDKGTAHVFSLAAGGKQQGGGGSSSSSGAAGGGARGQQQQGGGSGGGGGGESGGSGNGGSEVAGSPSRSNPLSALSFVSVSSAAAA